MKSNTQHIIIGLVAVVLVLCIYSCTVSSDNKEIAAWVAERGETLITIDSRSWDIGPYWHVKGARYYCVSTNKHVYWFKYCLGRTIKAENSDGTYQSIED